MEQDILENPIFKQIIELYVKKAEDVFRREVALQGVVLTGEMLNSIRSSAVEQGTDFIQGHVHFSAIMRLKDMKSLNFIRTPPLAAMRDFVEKVGVRNFAFVPGYNKGFRPVDAIAIERIAWGIKTSIKQGPNVKRGYRGIYNDPMKNEILPLFFHDLRTNAGAVALQNLRILFTDNI